MYMFVNIIKLHLIRCFIDIYMIYITKDMIQATCVIKNVFLKTSQKCTKLYFSKITKVLMTEYCQVCHDYRFQLDHVNHCVTCTNNLKNVFYSVI